MKKFKDATVAKFEAKETYLSVETVESLKIPRTVKFDIRKGVYRL